MTKPLFTVIIPAYNRQNFLKHSIESVLNQSFSSFELLIVDDGSTDQSSEVIKFYVAQDHRVRYLYQENKERGVARNLGIRSASGKWICFLDSDDVFLRSHLETLAEAIYSEASVGILATRFCYFMDGVDIKAPIAKMAAGLISKFHLLEGNYFGVNVCIRNVPDLIPFREEREYSSMEDWIFILENHANFGLRLLDAVTVKMREHPGRSMQNHAHVILQRQAASDFIIQTYQLTPCENRYLRAHTYFFCSVHSNLQRDSRSALNFLYYALSLGYPVSKGITHFLRIVLAPILFSGFFISVSMRCRVRKP